MAIAASSPPSVSSLEFSRADRLLVVAPHPDDETLACGELIQCALAAGASVRVLLASDGDDNPWPQRWLERRLWIGAAARRRWGERRRAEALAALEVLGAGAIEVRCLGWPDQGLTRALLADDAAVTLLAAELGTFAPTQLVMPALADRHPDHSALHVALALALLRTRLPCRCLRYGVHGGSGPTGTPLPSAPPHLQRKLAALACHASQLALSRRRLLAIAQRPEWFDLAAAPAADPAKALAEPVMLRLTAQARWPLRHELLVLAASADGSVSRIRAPLGLPGRTPFAIDTGAVTLRLQGGDLQLARTGSTSPLVAVWAKLHRSEPRLIVFDRDGWQQAEA